MFTTPWAFLIVFVICATICRVAALKVRSRDTRNNDPDEVRTIQEIHRGLQRMEERLEALETIIMDRSGSHKAYSDYE